jgi:hypothetical protein
METKNKKLILSLIRDNLKNTRLVLGLNELGFSAGDYLLHLSETVIDLMDIKNLTEDEFESYQDLYEQVIEIDVTEDSKPLNRLSESIYQHLIILKANR